VACVERLTGGPAHLLWVRTNTSESVIQLVRQNPPGETTVIVEDETSLGHYQRGGTPGAMWGRARGRMIGALKVLGYRVELVRAGRKLAPELWRVYWGWKGRLPSEHARAAAMLAVRWRG
jgi:hypothetical protein